MTPNDIVLVDYFKEVGTHSAALLGRAIGLLMAPALLLAHVIGPAWRAILLCAPLRALSGCGFFT
jgi:hypothetical protein